MGVFLENMITQNYIKKFLRDKGNQKSIKVLGNIKPTGKRFGAFYVGATYLQCHRICFIQDANKRATRNLREILEKEKTFTAELTIFHLENLWTETKTS